MTTIAALVPVADDDARWRAWQAGYAASDRQGTRTMMIVFGLAFAGVLVSLAVQLN